MPSLPSMTDVKTKLTGTVAHNLVRVILVAHILVTSYWPTSYVNIFQHLATRIVLAIVIVGLLFWDIIAGALLAILLVITIQESKSRKIANSAVTTLPIQGDTSLLANLGSIFNLSNNSQIQSALGNLKQQVPEIKKELVAASVYGRQQIPSMSAEPERIGAYMDQIGELSISHQIKAGQGVHIIDGIPAVKVNMNQIGQTYNPISDLKESLTNNLPSVYMDSTTEYDHPVNKTMSENLKIQGTGFITDKNLLDAQINSIGGLDGTHPPCFVASESGIWNAQGFGSIARAVDNEDCPHSFV